MHQRKGTAPVSVRGSRPPKSIANGLRCPIPYIVEIEETQGQSFANRLMSTEFDTGCDGMVCSAKLEILVNIQTEETLI